MTRNRSRVGCRRHQAVRLTDITDDTSNTIHVAERPPPDTAQAGDWYQSSWGREDFAGPTGTMHHYQAPFVVGDPCPSSLHGPGRTDNQCDRYHYWSLHRGGANFLFCDGAVALLRTRIRRPASSRGRMPASRPEVRGLSRTAGGGAF